MRILAVGLLILCEAFGPVSHIFEDGFVERSVSIIVRDRTGHCEYSIGLNDNTLREVLSEWNGSSDKDGKQIKSAILSDSAERLAERKNEITPENDENAPELLKRLNEEGPSAIAKRLNITCNGKPVKLNAITVGPAPRHPFCLIVKFEFEIPESDSIELKFNDENFRRQSGAFRSALKTRGKAVLLQSDTAPILVRAKRILLAELSTGERKTATSFSAKIAVLAK